MSTYPRDTILVDNLVQEISGIAGISSLKPIIKSTMFEVKEGALKREKSSSLTLLNKHLELEIHHYRSCPHSGKVVIENINTKEKVA